MTPNTRGAALMMGSTAAFTLNDTCIKATGGEVPLMQLLTLRGGVSCLLLYLLARYLGALRLRLSRGDLGLLALRSGTEVVAAYLFLVALMTMPLANVTAVLQVLPLTVTLGAALVFGERIGWRRLLAIGLGFCGMLLIVRPGPEGFSPHTGYVLAAVLCVTVRDLATRRMSSHVPTMTVTVLSAFAVFACAGIASLWEDWAPLDTGHVALIGGSAIFVMLGYVLSVMVMRVGEVSFVAPFRYTGLIWALVLGWLVFGHWPAPLTLLGVAVVAAAGLFTLYRGRQVAVENTRRT
ncbi:DMT family transporter [Pseudodonghicola flavimaris]|uniref:DMT family transporter n=1 Tax=Pseudodonghicola flavimaris TaxID=3050036 RepID=A0ABT7F229_9RHOB|nr:DMT family transporter [Pseudodonghicola flavimaris]MDK3018658.1 DMT family transporter [Pseudodonghicola flavimaris]